MRKFRVNWRLLARSIGAGVIFGLIAFLISGDTSSSALGLLVAYIEYRIIS